MDPAEMFPAGSSHVHTRRVTVASGLCLRVAEAGDHTHPPLLLLHGWGASIYMWRDWFMPLAAAGRRVIAIDLPGHGLSDKPKSARAYRLDALMQVVREFLDAEGIATTDVVAQSMAGTIALELAMERPSRIGRAVLVNPACFGRVRLQRLGRMLSPSFVDDLLPHLVARWIIARAHRMVYGDPSRITRRDEEEYWAPSQFPSYARAMRRLVHEFRWTRPPARDMARRLSVLDREVLVVLGTKDSLVRDAPAYVAELRELGARLQVRMVEGGGHAVNEERASEVVNLVLEYLN
jgi:pimeloyl-ACP methyl ester carboxylesterase